MVFFSTQLLLLLLLPILGSLLLLARSGRKGKLAPGPVGMPVLGNLRHLGPLPHRNLRDLARRHGPVMLLRLGATRMLVVSSASAAREVLQTHDADCCSRTAGPGPKLLSYGFKDVAFAPYGEQWREMRKLFVKEFVSMRRVKAAWGARQAQVEKLMAGLTPNTPVALGERIYGLVNGIICTVAFGNVYGAEMFHRVLGEALELQASFSAEDFFPNAAGRLVDRLTGLAASRNRSFAAIDTFLEVVIEQHLEPKSEREGSDLVDVLINLSKEHPAFTTDNVKAILMDTFVGGVNTTSVTILWAMSELIRNPRVLKKVQKEIRVAARGNNWVQPEDMPKLSYLRMVVKETLRLYPPATLLLPRETLQNVKIGGYDVPARTRVAVNVWAIGRDPTSWGEGAEEFDPDRFEAGASHGEVDLHGAHFELLPFGAGRRICPGIAMALMNVEFTLANLLCGFDWALPEGTEVEDISMEETGAGLTFHRKTPLVLVPTLPQRA